METVCGLAPPLEHPEGAHRRTTARAMERTMVGHRGETDNYVTVTVTDADVVAFPALSVAIAVSVCWPFVAFFVFQLTK